MIPIQFITYATDKFTHEDTAKIALDGGCKWVEIHTTSQEEIGRIIDACHKHEATCILYDNIDLCKSLKADGVRLAPGRTDIMEAREALGHEFIIGATAACFDHIKKYKRNGADYICCGTYSPTPISHTDTIDLSYYASLMRELYTQELRIPVCAYGHITTADIMPLIDNGVQGICIGQPSFGNDLSSEAISPMLNADQ